MNSNLFQVRPFFCYTHTSTVQLHGLRKLLWLTAVETGSVVELQHHLDRRKFALSRDLGTAVNILHKAVALDHQELAR